MRKKILVVVSHPDDEVLGCGGTIARLAKERYDIYLAILGEGITSRYKEREEADTELTKELHKRSHQVAELLGIKDLFFNSLPDNRFDAVPLLDVVKIVEDLIEKLEPLAIYTHYSGDLNIDHVITHRAVLTATRPTEGHSVKEIYAFEVPSSTEWAFGQYNGAFNPNVFVDISETLDRKIQAMEIYESETRIFPHPRSQQSLRALAEYRGIAVGLKAAECFKVLRIVK